MAGNLPRPGGSTLKRRDARIFFQTLRCFIVARSNLKCNTFLV